MSTFVCLDGEGLDTTRDTRTHRWTHQDPLTGEKHHDIYTSQEHIYTFMGSSSGNYIRDWVNGLSTAQCFEFILSEKVKDAILVGFSFGYDSCMMFRDIDTSSLKLLWETGRTYTYQEGHLYKIDYFPGKWVTISCIERLPTGKTRVIKSAKVWDVFGFFQHSFIRSLEEWLTDIPDNILNTIARMKEERGKFTGDSQGEIESYCLEECRLLQTLMEKLRDTLERTDIHLKSWHGAGAISGNLFASHGIDRHVHWDDIPELAQDASLCSYFGGRVELFQQGFIDPPIYDYDVVSAYPAAIIDLPSLRRGVWYGCEGGEVNVRSRYTTYGMWRVTWDTRNTGLSWLAPFPQRGTDGGIYWSETGSGWYHTTEVLAALKVFGSRIKVEQGVYLIPASWDEKPFSWLAEIMEKRIEYKNHGDPRHIVLKLAANSGYGKLAQGSSRSGYQFHAGSRPRFQNYYLAGRITATCRAKMLILASQFDRADVICAATDGLYTRALCDGVPNTPRNLGTWEIKGPKTERAFFGQAGVMFTENGKEVKTRGFRKTSVCFQDIVNAWHVASGDWAVFGLSYKERRFNGLGYCASTGRWDEFRRWVDREREFSLRTDPRKRHVETGNGQEWCYLSPGDPPLSTKPYSPKESGAEITDSELLELIDIMSQPEYVG